MIEIIATPFDWNDNMSEIAQEDFSQIQKNLSYGTAMTIGIALAKLELLEKQGCKVEPQEGEQEPKIGHCKDCKHMRYWSHPFGRTIECSKDILLCPTDNDFCSKYERK